ncbi:hypothetical protein AB0M54_24375 [Actinoplanes sp. NPDC051470]|uniref:hypothetical protein n=1 Tax=Actinoplanes sp. NPDC051470 TaxID=3157224 RepID=UPI00343A562A
MTDPIVVAARFIADNLEWLRHRPEAAEVLADVDAALRVVRGLARGPAEQKYLGPCGALVLTPEPWEPGTPSSATCEGDVYAPRGGSRGRCRLCGAEVASREREAWLDGRVRQEAFRAYEIADAYGLRENTIRVHAHRGQLKSYWRTETGIVADWPPPEGEKHDRLHYLGDVLDMAAAEAARREEARAKRARRAATQESEDAA